MPPHSDNKYTVNQRIGALTTRVTELESALKALRVTLLAELQTYLDVHCHGMNGVDGRNGVDGQSIVGPAGPRGDVLYIGPEEIEPVIAAYRAELIRQRAQFQAAIFQALADANGPHAKLWRKRLEDLKQMAGL